MKNTTAIVISFLRPAYTIGCIESLRACYPDIKIIVGENGDYDGKVAEVCNKVIAKYIQLPFDSGVCVGRNTLMQHVETEYVLVGDDDFFYKPDTGVEKMREFLGRHPEFDLIGGRIFEGGVVRNYQGSIERHGHYLKNTPIDLVNAQYGYDEKLEMHYIKTDLVFNFFVARTAVIKPVPWDDQIKVAYEHESWFMDLQEAGVNVAFSPEPIVIHKAEHLRAQILDNKEQHSQYQIFRMRRSDKERFYTRHKLDYLIDMNGRTDYAPNNIVEKRKNDTKYVDFCITTFKRPKSLEKLLFSIAKYYPMANIYVADQNEKFDNIYYRDLRTRLMGAGIVKRISFESLPYDCGLSYARNHLVRTTPNKYKLILDDDFEFTRDTDIGKMVRLLEVMPHVGIVGGLVKQLDHEMHFEFNIVREGNTIRHVSDGNPWRTEDGIRYRRTGCVLNFALMRKDLFNHILWDQDLKVTEHLDFYIRMQKVPYQIIYTPEVSVGHPPAERSENYKEMRQRPEFQAIMLKKHGVTRVKYENGQVTELMPDGSLKRYKELP